MEQDTKSSFGVTSTAEDVTEGVDASGLTAIVTGATSGIGSETARVLALRGAHVYLTGRSVKSATETMNAILKEIPHAKLDVLAPLDLSSQASVRKCAESFLALDQPLNLLINNAGIMMAPHGLTEDGIEVHFGTNHIGHFLFTNLLLEKLVETANKTGIESRIVILSSSGIRYPAPDPVEWDKDSLNEDKGKNGLMAYGISKLANVYHAQELARQLQEKGITNVTVNSLHPGRIRTSLGRHSKWIIGFLYLTTFWSWKSIPQATSTTCYVALHPSVKGVSGKFFVDNKEFDPKAYNPLAEDEQQAKKLWDLSVQLTST
ncbi:unnamed protein product [Calypogeia fissa]